MSDSRDPHSLACAAGSSLDAAELAVAEVIAEITDRLQAGERVDLEAYIARCPQGAERIRRLVPALAGLEGLKGSEEPRDAKPEDPFDVLSGTLGDFRILREVGRGGMGVVYEAEQISLRRRVALKVLPFAGALDPRHLQRFQREAEAAAQLHHTHIVPVFFVGSERGVHFYAMQLIAGRTLADVVAELRGPGSSLHAPPPDAKEANEPGAPTVAAATTQRSRPDRAHYRTVARWGVQAAEALEYAHSMGVIHRDVKPANLLLDARGEVWVTDFGLAQFRAGAELTMTGDVLGTLRYMSPEQARARHGLVDHRTDVYSLGVTLYELLTLRPAFAAEDREVLLRQVTTEDPTPLRRLNPAIPAELETIVLKAVAKEPEARYATAGELAEDLSRFLADQPIRARRPTLARRAAKWAARHRAGVRAAAVVLLVTVVLAAGAGMWWLSQRAEADRQAVTALEDAGRLQQERRWPEALAAARRAEPLLFTGLLNPVTKEQVQRRLRDLALVVHLEDLRFSQLEMVVYLGEGGLRRGVTQYSDDNDIVGGYRTAFRDYGVDVETVEAEEAARHLRTSDVRSELAAALGYWAFVRRRLDSHGPGWRKLLDMARLADPGEGRAQLWGALKQSDVGALEALASSEGSLRLSPSSLELLGRALRERGAIQQAVALLRDARRMQPNDFGINFELGVAAVHLNPPQWDEAIRCYTAAVALRPQRSLIVRNNLTHALFEKGDLDEALAECERVIALSPQYAKAHMHLGAALARKGRLGEAVQAFRKAIELDPRYALARANLAGVLRASGRLGEAIEVLIEATRRHPDSGEAHYQLGVIQRMSKRLDEAILSLQRATRLKPDWAAAWDGLGVVLYAVGRPDEAFRAFRQAINVGPNHASAWLNLGNTLRLKGRLEEAVMAHRQAALVQPDYAIAYYRLGLLLNQLGRFAEGLAEMRRAHAWGARQPNWPHPTGRLVEEGERLVEFDNRLAMVLRGEMRPAGAGQQILLAQTAQHPYKRLYATAARFYLEAFATDPAEANNVQTGRRYDAACCAALASCGTSKDKPAPDQAERLRWRRQALTWLHADLRAWCRLLEKEPAKARPEVAKQMRHWLADADFAGVRGEPALTRLPWEERTAWEYLWREVEALRRQAEEPQKQPTRGP